MNKPWLIGVVLAVVFTAGWQVANWQRDSTELTIATAAKTAGEASRQAMQDIASQSGQKLESQLEAIRNAPNKEIYREIVKPVFTNECLSGEFVSLYNAAVERTERALSGKPEKEMSGK
ncbi:hypothetical protein [Pectobacterium carotovorum]|uniref:hypothetical protein n=1 Tax=Pectobacterium carotovorum TaxID=554 RepID=UPI001887B6A9|nr:hypothetical protein [Pectobacterium carotovorum]MBG0750140.1 hypothetical protein [Pectobacterium carotovorum subsp. carotovorum PCCS1]GLY60101.1 hypothetical protein Pcaca05_09590 [Pectobacterium carotovorum subsp. carotovorum]